MSLFLLPALRKLILGAYLGAWPVAAIAQSWFGQPLPPPLDEPSVSVVPFSAAELPAVPAMFGPGPKSPVFNGDKIWADTKTIVDFSLKSKAQGDFRWGRVAGTQTHRDAVAWVVEQMKAAGLQDAHLEEFPITWSIPTSLEVKLLADSAYGEGSKDIILKSADLTGLGGVNGTVTAPMIYVGHGTVADMLGRDVKGKIAVMHVTPNPGMLAADEFGRARGLMDAGAVGVIQILEMPGNMQTYSPVNRAGDCFCFNVGGQDGFFLENILGKAGLIGKTVTAKLSVASPTQHLTGVNGVATVPGKSKRTIILNLHADAWYLGADDNAGGVAVGIALARYFANRKPDHTLVFMVSAGHHTPTPSGIMAFRAVHDRDYVDNTDLIINIEHVAASALVRATSRRQNDNFGRAWVSATTDLPKEVSVSNLAPYLIDIWRKGSACFGLSLERIVDSVDPGEPSSGYRDLEKNVPVTQMLSTGPLYHTTRENMDSVPPAALERAARFHAFMIDAADKAAPELLKGAPFVPQTSCPPTP